MRLGRVVAYLLIGLGAVVMMLPFYWMVITAVSPAPDIIAFPPKWIPSHLTLDHFREAAAKAPWLLYYKNSLVVATRSEEHTSELQSRFDLVCRLLLEKKKK